MNEFRTKYRRFEGAKMSLKDEVVMNQQPQIIKKHRTEEFYKKRMREKKNYYHSLIEEKVSAHMLDAELTPRGISKKERQKLFQEEQLKRSTRIGQFNIEEQQRYAPVKRQFFAYPT